MPEPRSPLTAIWRGKSAHALLLAGSRGAGVAAQMAVQLVVGALGGPALLGLLQLFTSWSCIAGELVARGHPVQSMRRTAVSWRNGEPQTVASELRLRVSSIMRTALPLVTVTLLAAWLLPLSQGELFIAVALTAPAFALLRLMAETLKALDQPLAAVTLENLGVPLALLALGGWTAARGTQLDATLLLIVAVIATAGTAVAVAACIRRRIGRRQKRQPTGALEGARERNALWLNGALGIAFLHLPFLILPIYVDTAAIGVFAVAHKLLNIVTTLLILMGAVFGPRFARAAAEADIAQLRAQLRETQRLSLVVFLPIAGVLLLASAPLTAVFSLPEGSLQPLLVVLAVGQLCNAATGLSGVLLNMAGKAHLELISVVIAAALAVVASGLIGPTAGLIGLAWVFTLTLCVKNLVSLLLARHFLNELESAS